MSVPRAESLFSGGEIVTLDSRRPTVEALAIAHGRIIALGTMAEVRMFCDARTVEVNLDGRVLLPSLKDHHLHLQAIGFSLLNMKKGGGLFLDLSPVQSGEEMISLAVARTAGTTPGSWIVGSGWNENHWENKRMPTHEALSRALPDHPAFMVRIDSHSALVNAAAMQLAGIGNETADPYGGEIRRLPDGAPSGMLIERAVEPVLAVMPLPSDDVVREATLLAAHVLAARGYTEVYDAGIMHFPGLVAMNSPMEHWIGILRDVDETDGLPLNVNIMLAAPSSLAEGVLSGAVKRRISPHVAYTHLKLYADGAFGSRGALMSEDYSDDPGNRGIARMTEVEMLEQAKRAIAVGLDVAIHAIGDTAVTRVLNVYEELLRIDPAIAPRRLRLEHFSVASEADIKRAARLGILIVAQPGFVWPMRDGRCMEDSRLGAARLNRAYAWRTLLSLGAQIAGSSDDYGALPHPLWNFYAAVTRKNPEGIPHGGWQGQECITREEGLRLFMRWAAPGGEWIGGTLSEGEAANLVVMSANPLTVNESAILGIEVYATLHAGRLVFSDPRL